MPDFNEIGLRQGSYIRGQRLSAAVQQGIQQGRPLPDKRESPFENRHLAIVLSQDCDLVNDTERHLELVCCKPLPQKRVHQPSTLGATPKKLHLPLEDGFWEADPHLVSTVPKESLQSLVASDVAGRLDDRLLEILISWRVSRYAREPFPDQFNRQFITNYLKNPEYGLGDYLEANYEYITEVHAFVDPDDDAAQEFSVILTAVLETDCPDSKRSEIEQELSAHINRLQRLDNGLDMPQTREPPLHPKDGNTRLVAAPDEFTLLDLQRTRRLSLDYLCHPEDD